MVTRIVTPGSKQLHTIWPEQQPNPDLAPNPIYNASPGTMVPTVTTHGGTKTITLDTAFWGLLPEFAPDKRFGKHTTTADIETVLTRRSFREPIRAHRVLIPVLGYYLWQTRADENSQQVFYVSNRNQEIITLGGIASHWVLPAHKLTGNYVPGEGLLTISIITEPASPPLDNIHDRTPIVVEVQLRDTWLNAKPDDTSELLDQVHTQSVKYGSELQCWQVSNEVSNIRKQGQMLVVPLNS